MDSHNFETTQTILP